MIGLGKNVIEVLYYVEASSDIRRVLDALTGLPDKDDLFIVPSVPVCLLHESLREVALFNCDEKSQSWKNE